MADTFSTRLLDESNGYGGDFADLLRDAATELDSLSAHVETLTQQVANWKKLGDGVAIEDEQLQALAAELGVPLPEDRQGYTGKHTMFSVIRWLQQENARLTAEVAEAKASEERQYDQSVEATVRMLQAEQQRDAALAALELAAKAIDGLVDQQAMPDDSWKPARAALDVALAASAPQKEK